MRMYFKNTNDDGFKEAETRIILHSHINNVYRSKNENININIISCSVLGYIYTLPVDISTGM